ncbi:hypothetical protein [Streptomyces pristinaespiralis]|uniref:hypothetical protein n=1 Tax=Streptomyces pristinaespiralis TaxID=38300 RepID=UPI00383872BF
MDGCHDGQRRPPAAAPYGAEQYIKLNSGWGWPGSKPDRDRTVDERWAAIRKAVEDQASGNLHKDGVTKDFSYSRTDAETLIAMAAALLRLL